MTGRPAAFANPGVIPDRISGCSVSPAEGSLMSVRKTAFAATVLLLALVFASRSPAKPPPTGDKTAPTGPTNLRITASSATSISLAWDPSTKGSTNWWYCVQRDGLGCIRIDPPQTTFTNPKLWPDTTYNYSIIAVDANGNRSAPSNTVTYTTPPDTTAPSPPPALTTTSVYPARISVSWTASTDNTSQVSYALFVDGSPFVAGQLGYRTALLTHVAPSTTHTFRVTARDYFGNTVESNLLSVTTPAATDTTAPTAPANLRFAPETSPPEAWLDWDPSTDDVDPQSQILYEVYVNGELAGESTTIGYASTIAYCRTEGPNSFVVRAFDTSGNASAPSNEIVLSC